ncbi:unnamed protein product [Boreogadus saida]
MKFKDMVLWSGALGEPCPQGYLRRRSATAVRATTTKAGLEPQSGRRRLYPGAMAPGESGNEKSFQPESNFP